jgi:hypothetical protein
MFFAWEAWGIDVRARLSAEAARRVQLCRMLTTISFNPKHVSFLDRTTFAATSIEVILFDGDARHYIIDHDFLVDVDESKARRYIGGAGKLLFRRISRFSGTSVSRDWP